MSVSPNPDPCSNSDLIQRALSEAVNKNNNQEVHHRITNVFIFVIFVYFMRMKAYIGKTSKQLSNSGQMHVSGMEQVHNIVKHAGQIFSFIEYEARKIALQFQIFPICYN